MSFDLLIATNNDHKLKEYKELFKNYDITLHSPKELGIAFNPVENGQTYQANSLIKAKALQKYSKMPILADDSGFEASGLNNQPGIYSSRFAKKYPSQELANQAIIDMTANKDKKARFVCALTLLNFEDEPLYFIGIANGEILTSPHGKEGFGYDPIFYSLEAQKPFGELSMSEKNRFSHRGKAVKCLIDYLKDNFLI